MERKEFIRASCSLCLAIGAGLITVGLSSCNPIPIYETRVKDRSISVPLSLFAESRIQIVRPENVEYDIAVEKRNDGKFIALLLRCTHADNPLDFDGKKFYCTLHGSTFNEEGDATHGPAQHPLIRLTAEVSGSDVIVYM